MSLKERLVKYPILFTGIAYGLSMALGALLSLFLFNNQVVRALIGLLDPVQLLLKLLASVILIFLFVGLGGGITGALGGWALGAINPALGYAFEHIKKRRPLFPDSRSWRIIRNVALGDIFFILFLAAAKLIESLTVRQSDLAEKLPLLTQGTHWTSPENEEALASDVEMQTEIDSSAIQPETWCETGVVNVQFPNQNAEQIPFPPCSNQPVIAQDGAGMWRAIWYSPAAERATGAVANGHLLYESIYAGSNWTEPAIIARLTEPTQPSLVGVEDGTLLLTWTDQGSEKMASMTPYSCESVPLTPTGEAVYAVLRQEKFRPVSDPIPFCGNRFDRLHYTPFKNSTYYSDSPEPVDNAFDTVANLVRSAEYEVLFTTMQWDKPSELGSPGDTLSPAVADLYANLKAHPEQYPRGLTVRILLGNVLELGLFDFTSQVYHVMQDLSEAGVTEPTNEELGWRLEVANYGGAWPHAHSKFVVVDGKTAVAAGFNYSYLHLPLEHPSGQGLDMTDKALQITGPVAQPVLAAYDDLWSGSDLVHCLFFPPLIPALSFLTCSTEEAVVDHTPEVLRFYVKEENDTAFALHHTLKFHEADEAILAAIESAQESIDLYEVNFSLDTVCVVLGLLTDACQAENAIPPYQQALLKAVNENDVKIRAIVEPSAMNGFENRMAIRWWQNELEKSGKADNIEIKFADNKMHDKSLVIDNELLIIGSQNFHWSAWGCSEFNGIQSGH